MHVRLLNMALLLGVSLGMIGRMQTSDVRMASSQQQSAFAKRFQDVKNRPISRALMAQKVYTAFKKVLDKAAVPLPRTSPYQDISTNDPDFHAILVLNKLNIAYGSTDQKFHPMESLSRYELAKVMDRLVTVLKPNGLDSLLNAESTIPSDIPQRYDDSPSQRSAVKMLKLGVMQVFMDGFFRGKRPATDTEVADALTTVSDLVKAGRRIKNQPDKK